MRACVGCLVALVVGFGRTAEAQPGASAEPNGRGSGWMYEVAVGPAADFTDSCCEKYDLYRSMSVRLGVGQLTAPRLAVSLRLVWDIPLVDTYTGNFKPRPQDFLSLAGPSLTCWLFDNAWLGSTFGASAISVFDHKDGAAAGTYNDLALGLSARAGYTFLSNGTDDFDVSVEGWWAFDSRSTRSYSILVGVRRW